MNRINVVATALLALFAAPAQAQVATVADVTIYLEEPILSEGGTVVVLPTPVGPAVWQKTERLENSASDDRVLESARPLETGDRRLGVVVSAPTSVVRFNFPEGGDFRYAFAPLDRSIQAVGTAATTLVNNGRGSAIDPRTNERVEVSRIFVVHVLGRNASEATSRRSGRNVRFVALEYHYPCRPFEQAVACDASQRDD